MSNTPSASTSTDQSPAMLDLINQVLDFIRGNLQNIERTWGANSSQYATARDMMQKYWDANAQTLRQRQRQNDDGDGINLDAKLEDLLAGLSLSSSQNEQPIGRTERGGGDNGDEKMSWGFCFNEDFIPGLLSYSWLSWSVV